MKLSGIFWGMPKFVGIFWFVAPVTGKVRVPPPRWGIRSSVGIQALPFRPLYNNMSLLHLNKYSSL